MPALAWLQQCLNEDTLNASLTAAAERDRSFQLQASGLRVELSVSAGSDPEIAPNLRAARPDHVLNFTIRAWRGREVLGSRALSVQETECAALPDAVALVVLLLARNAGSTEEAAPPSTAGLPAAPDSETPPGLTAALEPRAAPDTQLFGIGAGASAVLGVLPSTALAVQVAAETAPAWFGVQLRGTLLWPQTRTIAEGSVRFEGYRLGLLGCLAWGPEPSSRLDLRACAGPAASWLRASGRGFSLRNDATTKLAIHAELQLQAAWALVGATWLRIHAGAGVALQRPRFLLAVGDSTEVRELPSPSVVAGELGFSLVQIF
jgi:hypothetical protein